MSRRAASLLISLGVLSLLALAWMVFLPAAATYALRRATGFDVRVDALAVNPFTGRVVVRGLVARNPPAWPTPPFAEIRSLTADVSLLSALFSDRLVIEDLDLDVTSVELVRRANGRSNATEFMAAWSRPPPPGEPPPKPFLYVVRLLHLRLDRLVLADAGSGSLVEHPYRLQIDQTYHNISDARELLVPGVMSRLYTVGVRTDISTMLPGPFGTALSGAMGAAATVGDQLKQAGRKTGNFLKGVLDKLEQSAKP